MFVKKIVGRFVRSETSISYLAYKWSISRYTACGSKIEGLHLVPFLYKLLVFRATTFGGIDFDIQLMKQKPKIGILLISSMKKFNFCKSSHKMSTPITFEIGHILQNISLFSLSTIQFNSKMLKFDSGPYLDLKRPLETDLNFISKLKVKVVFCYIFCSSYFKNLVGRAN